MKIVFTGDSYTWGAELENNIESRYSRIMCKSMNAEEVNLGVGGSANDPIFLRLIEYLQNNTADYVIIQLSDVHRIAIAHPHTEEFKSLNYRSSSNNMKFHMADVRQKVGKYIYDIGKKGTKSWYRMTRYKIWLTDLYLKEKGINYIICVKSEEIDDYLNDPGISQHIKDKFFTPSLRELCYGNRTQGVDKGHPNEQGHKIIAKALEEKLRELYF